MNREAVQPTRGRRLTQTALCLVQLTDVLEDFSAGSRWLALRKLMLGLTDQGAQLLAIRAYIQSEAREGLTDVISVQAPKVLETKPGPPPVLTKRGADVLVRVEKLLDDAARTAAKAAATDPKQAKPASSTSALAFPQNYAEENANASAPRKN